jgi:hypothetical protein
VLIIVHLMLHVAWQSTLGETYLCNIICISSTANTQEATTHSAAPSKCIHSGTQKFHMSYLLPLSEGSGHVEHDANASFSWIRNENGNQEGH